jgi:hypothetical protein
MKTEKLGGKTCPSATLSTTNPTRTDPGSNPGLLSDTVHGTCWGVGLRPLKVGKHRDQYRPLLKLVTNCGLTKLESLFTVCGL